MLMQNYHNWREVGRAKNLPYDDEDLFHFFFNHASHEKSAAKVISDLAYEVYQMQVCLEGMLEDNLEALKESL